MHVKRLVIRRRDGEVFIQQAIYCLVEGGDPGLLGSAPCKHATVAAVLAPHPASERCSLRLPRASLASSAISAEPLSWHILISTGGDNMGQDLKSGQILRF